ncbi:MAG TPA: hypothetical protein VN698_13430, partial [Bacteroidia bacterium]|nr:hypothetical protein [Bacteroidia bacterium]
IQNGTQSTPFYFTDAVSGNQTINPVMLSNITTNGPNPLVGYTGAFYIGFRYVGNLATDSITTYAIDNVVIKN